MIRVLLGLCLLSLSMSSSAVPIDWADWTSADTNTASGSVGGVAIGFEGAQSPASQTNGGTNYWASNSAIYRGGDIDNGPEASADIIRITGSSNYRITFAEAVVDPVMAVLSIGRTNLPVEYLFDADFEIVNSGCGFWGGSCAGSLFEEPGNVLRGVEGHGVIQFQGTFTELNFSTNPAEFWHGFTIGIAGVADIPEPGLFALLSFALFGLGLAGRKRV